MFVVEELCDIFHKQNLYYIYPTWDHMLYLNKCLISIEVVFSKLIIIGAEQTTLMNN